MDKALLKTKTIGVLMGGLSGEREISLRSGENCLRALLALGYHAIALDVGRDVARRLEGERVEVAFLTLHGRYGEDGTIQGLLEIMGIPYTGSGVLASALGMHKVAAKKVVRASGLRTPDYHEVAPGEDPRVAAACAAATLGLPVMVKPVEEGSSLGVFLCHDYDELYTAIDNDLRDWGAVFVENYIVGTEITAGVLEQNGKLVVLPLLQLVPQREFYDYKAKYTEGLTEFVLPARLEPAVSAECEAAALAAFRAVGCRGYARIDMMVDEHGLPWFVEVNTLPGMTELSDLPAQARAAGLSYEELVETILLTAVRPRSSALVSDVLAGDA